MLRTIYWANEFTKLFTNTMTQQEFVQGITWRQEANYLDRLAGNDLDSEKSLDELVAEADYLNEDIYDARSDN